MNRSRIFIKEYNKAAIIKIVTVIGLEADSSFMTALIKEAVWDTEGRPKIKGAELDWLNDNYGWAAEELASHFVAEGI